MARLHPSAEVEDKFLENGILSNLTALVPPDVVKLPQT